MRKSPIIVLALAAAAIIVWCFVAGPTGKAAETRPADGAASAPAFNQDVHGARGFGADSARIDSQLTLKIPAEQADDVYRYLRESYTGKTAILKTQFPGINLHGQPMSDVSMFTDEYFDTAALDLYRTQNSARHRKRINTTDPNDRKSGRELVQMKVTPPGHFDLRNELKYQVTNFPARNDSHPLLKYVKGPEREDCANAFRKVGIDPAALRHILTVRQQRSRVYINWDDTNILSFSVDQGTADVLGAHATFASVDIGLVEITYTEADEAKRKTMWQIRDALMKDLVDHFPKLTVNSESKYTIVLTQLREAPLVRLSQDHAAALALAGLLALAAAAVAAAQWLEQRARARRGAATAA